MSKPAASKTGPKREIPLSIGHKTFLSSEAKAFQENLHAERQRREHFDKNKGNMFMPRNPLIGEQTPREGEGNPIMRPECGYESREFVAKDVVTGKIGVDEGRYNVLGNGPKNKKLLSTRVNTGYNVIAAKPGMEEIPTMPRVIAKSAKPIEVPIF